MGNVANIFSAELPACFYGEFASTTPTSHSIPSTILDCAAISVATQPRRGGLRDVTQAVCPIGLVCPGGRVVLTCDGRRPSGVGSLIAREQNRRRELDGELHRGDGSCPVCLLS